jgi:hypothetical protein
VEGAQLKLAQELKIETEVELEEVGHCWHVSFFKVR